MYSSLINYVQFFIIYITFFTFLSPAVDRSVPGVCLQVCSVCDNYIFLSVYSHASLLKKLFAFWLPFWLANLNCIPLFLFSLVCFCCMLFVPLPLNTTDSSPPLFLFFCCLHIRLLQLSVAQCFPLIDFLGLTPSVSLLLFLCKAARHCAPLNLFSLDLGSQ